MNTIPTVADWAADPNGALAAAQALAKATLADADASTQAIAMGIASQVLTAAAPIAGAAIAGPSGALAAAALTTVATSVAQQAAPAVAALTAQQQQLVTSAIQVGAAAVQAKLDPKGSK